MTTIQELKEICEAATDLGSGYAADKALRDFNDTFPPAFCLRLLAVVEAAQRTPTQT